jgi:hypothetical protein
MVVLDLDNRLGGAGAARAAPRALRDRLAVWVENRASRSSLGSLNSGGCARRQSIISSLLPTCSADPVQRWQD